ncbi:unnamed protein product [Paramecium primaurelia]|uniref:Uncharacterized protein n=2 Tax=Paramecium TaxID=5884 RepID=A0A8S1YF74_9CILI|nr:unnamed protein product [Paramecium primaurelia]CAD8211898.1 unnamed protein product [Paramecium pentaurelia]
MNNKVDKNHLHSNFWQRVQEEQLGVTFKSSWLNKITEDAEIQYVKEFKIKTAKDKFKHILQVPLIVTDKQFLRRRKTFQTYTKNATLDLYYLQLKKAKGLGKSISEKADYNQVIQQTKNNRLQNEYLNTFKKNQGIMYDNTLWSDRYYNGIIQQSRLANLQKVLQRNKFKGREELLAQFEQFFASKQLVPGAKKSVPELIKEISTAFGDVIPKDTEQDDKQEAHVRDKSLDLQRNEITINTRPCTQQAALRTSTEPRPQTHHNYYSQYSKPSFDLIDTNTRCSTNQVKQRKFKQNAVQRIKHILTQTDDVQLENKQVFKQLQTFQDQEGNQATHRSEVIKAKVQREQLISAFSTRNNVDVRKKFEKRKVYAEIV